MKSTIYVKLCIVFLIVFTACNKNEGLSSEVTENEFLMTQENAEKLGGNDIDTPDDDLNSHIATGDVDSPGGGGGGEGGCDFPVYAMNIDLYTFEENQEVTVSLFCRDIIRPVWDVSRSIMEDETLDIVTDHPGYSVNFQFEYDVTYKVQINRHLSFFHTGTESAFIRFSINESNELVFAKGSSIFWETSIGGSDEPGSLGGVAIIIP